MYALSFRLDGSKAYPLLCGAFYERIAEIYELPDLALLLKSVQEDVTWPGQAKVYFLDNLREYSERSIFLVQFALSPTATSSVSLFLYVESGQVQQIITQFPSRGDRNVSSKLLEILKSLAHELHVPAGDLQFVVEGFLEMGTVHYVRETRLSGFVWVDRLGRYLHVTEDPMRVKEVQRGMKSL